LEASPSEAIFFGRRASTVAHPLRAYALLELATGAFALVVTWLLRELPRITAAFGVPGGGPLGARVVLSLLLVVPPAFVMGGTLPLLTRFVARELPSVGRNFGILYGVNTLGAAFGAGLAGTWTIGAHGLWMTACAASVVNLAVAGASLLLALHTEKLEQSGTRAGGKDDEAAPRSLPSTGADSMAPVATILEGSRKGMTNVLLVAFAVAGFTSIGYEVLWFRLIGMFVHSTSYAFSMSLVAFLVGLVLGAILYATRLAGKLRDLEVFATAQLFLGFLGLLSMIALGHSSALAAFLARVLPGEVLLRLLVLAAIVMLVPSTVIGVVFPCVVQLATKHLRTAGRTVGALYAVNTIGGIVGSLLVGFVTIPLVGTQWSFVLVSMANVLLAAALVTLDEHAVKRERVRTYVAATMLVPLSLLTAPPGWLVSQWLARNAGQPLSVVEGRDGIVAVLSHSYEDSCKNEPGCPAECAKTPWDFRQIVSGSVSYASTSVLGRRYMSQLANLPMLSHPHPSNVLVVCFGTGTTAGTFARYDEMKRLTVVDVSPDVLAAAPYFESENHGVLKDPRTETVLDDGRHFLEAHPNARFDVISFEPPPPISAGIVSLYTREFYALIAKRLAPGGQVTQWIPLQEQSDIQNRMLVKSMLDVFPYVSLWIPALNEGVLLGSNEPVFLDMNTWRARWAEPEVGATLAHSGFASPVDLLGTFVADRAALDQFVHGFGAVTDDLPVVEYPLQRRERAFDVADVYANHASPLPFVRGLRADERLRLRATMAASEKMALAAKAHFAGNPAAATSLVLEAEKLAGPNAYTDFFGHSMYPCALWKDRH
jgi:spermidine synthase